jgi:pimeloyl-ACP methyl ester carboxylesterase
MLAAMTTAMAHNGDVRLAYEVLGPPDGEPLLLIMGLGMQMIAWPDDFCNALIDRGFTVARFDNRDSGASTHFIAAGRPSLLRILTRATAVAAYRLDDMAGDAAAVLDALGWDSAHVVGASMGGMIAQTLAIRHPARVRSLTSMMSTPSPRVGRPRMKVFVNLRHRHVTTAEQAGQRIVDVFRRIGSPAYPLDEQWLREAGKRGYERGHDDASVPRQLAAIRASGDRRPGLASVRVPTLVLHGDADPLVRPAGGRATAAAVPGARLIVFAGMGHDLPRELWPLMLDEIAKLAASAVSL